MEVWIQNNKSPVRTAITPAHIGGWRLGLGETVGRQAGNREQCATGVRRSPEQSREVIGCALHGEPWKDTRAFLPRETGSTAKL